MWVRNILASVCYQKWPFQKAALKMFWQKFCKGCKNKNKKNAKKMSQECSMKSRWNDK